MLHREARLGLAKPKRSLRVPEDGQRSGGRFWCFCFYRGANLPMSIAVESGAVTCSIRRWVPVVHREPTIVVTRFKLVPPGGRRALTLVGEGGRVVYIQNFLGRHKDLIPALEDTGFVIDANEVSRLYPWTWR